MSVENRLKTKTFEEQQALLARAHAKKTQALESHRRFGRMGMEAHARERDVALGEAWELYRRANHGPMVRWCRVFLMTGDNPGEVAASKSA